MKAYQIKIELMDSAPLIWRRVIMPADATFNRLHQTIQTVTNFQSDIADYHLYEFRLGEENLRITNDEEAIEEHKHFMKNRKEIEKKIRESAPDEFKELAENQIEQMQMPVKKPRIKIDDYLEKYKELHYLYDYGDHWMFLITLEDAVDDYKKGYPILLDGENTAPPEDVGGIPGYEEFLEAYHNASHPEHEEMREWAEMQNYREYDQDFINKMLKFVKYK